jgi:hypothetical protein
MTSAPDTAPTPASRWAEAVQTYFDGWTALLIQSGAPDAPRADPFALWRRAVDQWLEGWTLFFDQTLSTPEAAAMGGRLLDARLNLEKPLREMTTQAMADWLEFVNMASFQEQIRAAKQLNDVNLRLDELRELVEALTDQVAVLTAQGTESTPRTVTARAGGAA